jgi:glycosyltransferase involved in cell wall biosynthesis
VRPDSSISVLLPFANAEETLVETLNSIQEQTFVKFELIAIDDNSLDSSSKIIKSKQDHRFRVIKNPQRGLVSALNHGLELCKNEWVVRMDADDIMHPDRLKALSDFVSKNSDYDLIASQVSMFSKIGVDSGYREYMRWQNSVVSEQQIHDEIYVESPFAHPSVMFKNSTVLRLGGYREGDFPEDYELWLRMHQAGTRMIKIPETLLYWRDSESRLSRTASIYRRAAFDNIRAQYLSQDSRLQQNRPLVIWGAGRKTRKRADLLLSKGFTPAAWIDIDPKKIGNRIKGIAVVSAEWLSTQSPRPYILNYVTNHGAKEEIDECLQSMNFQKGTDYLSVG